MVFPVVIIGGGLAGLVTALELSLAGVEVMVVEKKSYPHHKVCGEYVSNEVRPYLESRGIDVDLAGASNISKMQFTTPGGNSLVTHLDLGGFGLSRFSLDELLYKKALGTGVRFLLQTTVKDIEEQKDFFNITTSSGDELRAEVVIGAYGKRSRIDRELDRSFMDQSSPYMAVKYHIRYDFPADTIALHNFRDGYCGISAIEDGRYCLCYLTRRDNLREFGRIEELEKGLLSKNPHLRRIFQEAEFLYAKPEVINEISFSRKEAVVGHVLMVGDTAGLITPLCGNGMAMAIRGGVIAAGGVADFLFSHRDRVRLEQTYASQWRDEFAGRLSLGRAVQRLFGRPVVSEIALATFKAFPTLIDVVVRNTHGEVMTMEGKKKAP